MLLPVLVTERSRLLVVVCRARSRLFSDVALPPAEACAVLLRVLASAPALALLVESVNRPTEFVVEERVVTSVLVAASTFTFFASMKMFSVALMLEPWVVRSLLASITIDLPALMLEPTLVLLSLVVVVLVVERNVTPLCAVP